MQSAYLTISVRFLLDEFHGRGDQGEPEWPPSPLRLFQTMVNASARQAGKGTVAILEWIERQPAPTIVATPPAAIQPRNGVKNYVPDNVGDIVAKSWSLGKDDDISQYRTAKEIKPTRLRDDAVVCYLWLLTDAADIDLPACRRMASAISAFGWGIDMVVVDAAVIPQADADTLVGQRWLPCEMEEGGVSLRVPVKGTLVDLQARYAASLNRISLENNAVFSPVPPLTAFRDVDYRKSTDQQSQPLAIFELRKLDDSGFAAFSATRKSLHLVGMLRHCATRLAPALGWDEQHVTEFVLGHGEERGAAHKPVDGPRLVFIPLPSIEFHGEAKGKTVGSIRRVLVTVSGVIPPSDFRALVRALEGQELIDEKTQAPVAFLCSASNRTNAVACYLTESHVWESVTPVVLPGYDDPRRLRQKLNAAMLSPKEKASVVEKLERRTETLLRKALQQAGFTPEVVGDARFYWRGSSFLQGTDLATNYSVPEQCRRYRRLHCRVEFSKPVKGPVCIGGGRHFGLGLFAAVPEGRTAQEGGE